LQWPHYTCTVFLFKLHVAPHPLPLLPFLEYHPTAAAADDRPCHPAAAVPLEAPPLVLQTMDVPFSRPTERQSFPIVQILQTEREPVP
jgi:hypothetical protein